MKKYVACMITFWFTCVMLCLVVTCVYADNPVGRLKAGDFNGFLDDALRTNWFNGMATAGASAVIASMLSGLVGAAAGAGVGGATGTTNRTNTSKTTGNTVQPPYTRKNEFNTDGSTDTSRSGTRILDGKDAISWMQDKDNGYIDKDGLPTKKFHEFMNSLFSQKGSGLQGFCGDIDADGNPTGDYVIIVDDDAPASQADDSRELDEQTQNTGKENQDKSTDNSSSESDATQNSGSETDASKNNDKGIIDESDNDQNDTPDISTKDGKDTTTKPEDAQTKPPVEQTAPVEYPNAKEDLEKMMGEVTKEKTKEGYYVKNRHDFERAFDYLHEKHPEDYNKITKKLTSDLGWTYDKITKILNNFPLLSGAIDYFGGWTGGQCGEYAKYGMDWSKKHLKDKYGDGTLIDDIVYMSKESDGINHGATKIILPNGDKYILDYWESMQTKKPAVYTEEEWIKKCENSPDLGKGGDVSMTTGERALKNAIGVPKLGEEKGKQWFLDHAKDKNIANSIIKAWEKKPW